MPKSFIGKSNLSFSSLESTSSNAHACKHGAVTRLIVFNEPAQVNEPTPVSEPRSARPRIQRSMRRSLPINQCCKKVVVVVVGVVGVVVGVAVVVAAATAAAEKAAAAEEVEEEAVVAEHLLKNTSL